MNFGDCEKYTPRLYEWLSDDFDMLGYQFMTSLIFRPYRQELSDGNVAKAGLVKKFVLLCEGYLQFSQLASCLSVPNFNKQVALLSQRGCAMLYVCQ